MNIVFHAAVNYVSKKISMASPFRDKTISILAASETKATMTKRNLQN